MRKLKAPFDLAAVGLLRETRLVFSTGGGGAAAGGGGGLKSGTEEKKHIS